MTLIILTKPKKQQLINWEIQSQGSFKIEANFRLSIYIIKVCEIYLQIFTDYMSNATLVFISSCREEFREKCVLRSSCSLI